MGDCGKCAQRGAISLGTGSKAKIVGRALCMSGVPNPPSASALLLTVGLELMVVGEPLFVSFEATVIIIFYFLKDSARGYYITGGYTGYQKHLPLWYTG